MSICPSCGAQNSNNDKFCTSCGSKLPVVEPAKAEEILKQVDDSSSIIDATPKYEAPKVETPKYEAPKYEEPKKDYYDINNYDEPEKSGSNGVAVAGFVVSLVSFFACCGCGFLWIVSLILSIVGAVKSKTVGKGKGLAIAGIIISAIQGLFIVAYLGYCVSIVARYPAVMEEYQKYGDISNDTVESILEEDFNLG